MDQRGVTLIETLLAVAVIGLVVPVLSTSVLQMSRQTVNNSTRVTALMPLESAGRLLGEDIPLAQETDLADPTSGTSMLTLEWTDWSDDSQYNTYSEGDATYTRRQVTYSLSGSNLERQNRLCDDWTLATQTCDGSWTTTTTIAAREVESIQFSRSGDLFTINIASDPRGAVGPREQRTYEIFGGLLSNLVPL